MLCVTDEDLVPVLVGVCEVESRVVDAVLGRDQPVLGDHGGSAAPASDLYSLQVTIYFRATNEPFHNQWGFLCDCKTSIIAKVLLELYFTSHPK